MRAAAARIKGATFKSILMRAVFESPLLPLELEIPGRQRNSVSSLNLYSPLVLISCDLVLYLGILKLLPNSFSYCLHFAGSFCGSW